MNKAEHWFWGLAFGVNSIGFLLELLSDEPSLGWAVINVFFMLISAIVPLVSEMDM